MTIRNRVVVKGNFAGKDVVVTQTERESIKEIKPNGDVVGIGSTESTVVSVDGMEIEQPALPAVTETRDRRGKLINLAVGDSASAGPDMETQSLLASLDAVILPEKPVKPGDTWTTDITNPLDKKRKLTITTVYTGAETSDGVAIYKFTQSASFAIHEGDEKTSCELSARLRQSDGAIVSEKAKFKNIPTQAGNNDIEVTVTALPAAAGAADQPQGK
jgi:hypothetical protein